MQGTNFTQKIKQVKLIGVKSLYFKTLCDSFIWKSYIQVRTNCLWEDSFVKAILITF